jgi:hypothetical protein
MSFGSRRDLFRMAIPAEPGKEPCSRKARLTRGRRSSEEPRRRNAVRLQRGVHLQRRRHQPARNLPSDPERSRPRAGRRRPPASPRRWPYFLAERRFAVPGRNVPSTRPRCSSRRRAPLSTHAVGHRPLGARPLPRWRCLLPWGCGSDRNAERSRVSADGPVTLPRDRLLDAVDYVAARHRDERSSHVSRRVGRCPRALRRDVRRSLQQGHARWPASRRMPTPHRRARRAGVARDHGVGVARGLRPVPGGEAASSDPGARRRRAPRSPRQPF